VFERVLIANRGEIAVRVARTLRRLGVEAVAVYSDADADAPHVHAADRALRLGPAAPSESYLHVERVVEAALRSGAEAVHPGYGFLSERPAFARACAAAGLAFVGPSPEAMALLGDKVAAKEAATAAGVPVLPGLSGGPLTDDEIVAWAAGAELPLLLKAAAGGGGRGMRVVRTLDELREALGAARREALGAFGDDRLLVERYVEHSRHIEVQVIADAHGTVLHLGERECSLQRRHQKVIEEAPSPVVDAALRVTLGAAAVALARSCGYVNAGTVELLAERDEGGGVESFFFLEMNARLQVEHPVTEAVTGLDLVELQLRVAAGEPLGLAQEDVALSGHAVEARLYAEDPARGFLPSTGRVVAYREPAGARVDSGIAEGVEVGADYDPLLAKLIAHGPHRAAALARLDRALGELVVLGPTTNGAYLRALIARPEVRAGALDTGLIERLGAEVAPPPPPPELPAVALAALLGGRAASDDPWDARDGWRIGEPAWIRARLGEDDAAVRRGADGRWEWQAAEAAGSFSLDGDLLTVDGATRPLGIDSDGDAVWLRDGACEPARFVVAAADRAARAAAGGSLEAPMPGVVIDVRVAAGDAVAEGDVLVVLESMKMELAVQSPGAGVVGEVLVATGDRVARGQALVATEAVS
jgi:acetyl-CoA/propionyl-CoA carboxylase, biotin carboxylase, biotin carboxyl carrier protein